MNHEATPPPSAAKYAAMGAGNSMGVSVLVGIGVLNTGTDEAARTHAKVRDAPVSKRAHTPASAAAGIEDAIRKLDGRWKLVILFHLFGGKTLRFSDLERAIPGISQKMLTQQLRQLEGTASLDALCTLKCRRKLNITSPSGDSLSARRSTDC